MIDDKVKGREITVPPKTPARGRIIDLMEALKESMKKAQRGKNQVEQKNRRKS
jgi:non-homologous end joining protein Ku